MDNYILYVHINKTNGKRYVGITSNRPAQRWHRGGGYKDQRRFYSAIQHYGWDGFEHIILASGLSKEEAERREEETIREYKSNDLRYGYNIENGGVIHKLSDEQKEHLRQVQLGRTHSEETKRKMSESHKGVSSSWLIGRKASDATRQKMSDHRKGSRNPRAVAVRQYSLDGTFIAQYDYMEKAKEAVGVKKSTHISQCCAGKRNKAYGYVWRYAEGGE